MRKAILKAGLLAGVVALGAPALFGALARADECDGVHDISCVINPIEQLSSGSNGTTAPDTNESAAPARDAPRMQPAASRPLSIVRDTRSHKSASPRRARNAHAKASDIDSKAEAVESEEVETKVSDQHSKSDTSAQTQAMPASNAAAQTTSAPAKTGAPDVWNGTATAPTPSTSPVVEADAYNEIDRQADSEGSTMRELASIKGDKMLDAMAMVEPQRTETRSWWQDVMPFGETSVIGQIFIMLGGLLSVGTALRMFLA